MLEKTISKKCSTSLNTNVLKGGQNVLIVLQALTKGKPFVFIIHLSVSIDSWGHKRTVLTGEILPVNPQPKYSPSNNLGSHPILLQHPF